MGSGASASPGDALKLVTVEDTRAYIETLAPELQKKIRASLESVNLESNITDDCLPPGSVKLNVGTKQHREELARNLESGSLTEEELIADHSPAAKDWRREEVGDLVEDLKKLDDALPERVDGTLQNLTLQVHNMIGLLCTVIADPQWTLEEVMSAIEEASGVPAKEQLLLHQNDALNNASPLKPFLVDTAVDITLIRRKIQERAPSPAPSAVSSCLEDDSYSCFS